MHKKPKITRPRTWTKCHERFEDESGIEIHSIQTCDTSTAGIGEQPKISFARDFMSFQENYIRTWNEAA